MSLQKITKLSICVRTCIMKCAYRRLQCDYKRLQLITEQSRTEIVVDSLDTLLYTHYDHPLPQEW